MLGFPGGRSFSIRPGQARGTPTCARNVLVAVVPIVGGSAAATAAASYTAAAATARRAERSRRFGGAVAEVERVQGRAGDAGGVQWFDAQIVQIEGEAFSSG